MNTSQKLCLSFITVIGSLFLTGLVLAIGSPTQSTSSYPAASATPEPIADITWAEFDAIYSTRTKKTDLQKDAAWPRFKGKRVAWNGTVAEVGKGLLGGLKLSVKMNDSTLTMDLIVDLKDSEKEKALLLQQGDAVYFTGTLHDWGSLLPSGLSDGEIH